jgi:hypothetical protein
MHAIIGPTLLTNKTAQPQGKPEARDGIMKKVRADANARDSKLRG